MKNVLIVPGYTAKKNIYSLTAPLTKSLEDRSCNVEVCDWSSITREMQASCDGLMKESDVWEQIGMPELRQKTLIPISLAIMMLSTKEIAYRFSDLILENIKRLQQRDDDESTSEIHVITQGLGTYLFLDALFSKRWNDELTEAHKSVFEIRNRICGLGSNDMKGLQFKTLHILGSNLLIYQYVHKFQESVHKKSPFVFSNNDYRPTVSSIAALYKTKWYNYVHPYDLIAFPVFTQKEVGFSKKNMSLENVIIKPKWPDIAGMILSSIPSCTGAAYLLFPLCHRSYLKSEQVMANICQSILSQ